MAIIAAGLSTRAHPWPDVVVAYGGDTLWASALYVGLRLLAPGGARGRALAVALALSLAVELSQLAQPPWLVAIRETLPGRLLLGRGFVWSDLPCYAAGALAAWGAEGSLIRALRR